MAVVQDSNMSWKNYVLSITVDPLENGSSWTFANVLFRTDNFVHSSSVQSGRAYELQIFCYDGSIVACDLPNYVGLIRTDYTTSSSTTLFSDDDSPFLSADPMEVMIRVVDANILVKINGNTIFNGTDPDPFLYGGIGIHAIWETKARFDNVLVYEFPTYSCVGFEPPMNNGPVTVKGKNRALPFKAELEKDGSPITDADIAAAPVIQVLFVSEGGGDPVDVTEDALPAGQGTEGNQFVYTEEDGKWHFNLKRTNYTAPGTYTVKMVSGDDMEYGIEQPTCEARFVIE
jgi:hypothetical protein